MASKKIRNNWNKLSKEQRQQYLINNVKSILGRVRNHDVALAKACDQIDDVAVDVDMSIDDDIQGIRMDYYGIDNANTLNPNSKDMHKLASKPIKRSLFGKGKPFDYDSNALRYIYHNDGSEALRAINKDDVLSFGEKVIEYLEHPDEVAV